MSVFMSMKSWDESASPVRRPADILVKRAGNGEDTRELARILHCCPIRPLDAGERGNAVGLVVGLDVGLHVVANAGAPLGGGGIYRVCAPGPACRGLRSRSSVRRSTLRYRSRPTVCSLARRETTGMTIRFSGPPSLPWRPIAVLGSDAWASRAGWPSGCRLQAELCNSYCTLVRGSLAQSWQMGLSSLKMWSSTFLRTKDRSACRVTSCQAPPESPIIAGKQAIRRPS